MYDVVVVGYGPTGMLAAIQLGRAGHRVAVIERHTTLYNLPRVGIVHDDVLRMFQEIGLSERIEPATYFLPVYELANQGKVLLSNRVEPNATHGWPEFISIYQPAFEAELDRLAKSLPNVDVLQGRTLVGLAQDGDRVTATVEHDGGARAEIEGRYLIGADGGNSFIREALGIAYQDLGFIQDWLVIDARLKRPREALGLPDLRQFCEPEQPGMTMQMGPDHRRWSFMIFPGERPEDAVKPESVWRRLNRREGGGPDDFEPIRVVNYKFQSLIAERWREGRIFLAGDAAHQMPPFLAQGMCSGFRDGYDLAWKLDLVLKGSAPPEFLDTYQSERFPSARATIVESMRVGQNVNERDPEKVRARDAQLMALQAEMERSGGSKPLIAFRVPGIETGFVAKGAAAAGEPFGQARVTQGGRAGLFDDVAGRGFQIVARRADPAAALAADDLAYWRGLGGGFVRIGGGAGEFSDPDGFYTGLMDTHGCDAIVKRPDFHVFGGCARVSGLPALIAELRGQLRSGAR